MEIYVDNKIVKSLSFYLISQGVDINKTLQKCDISKSELNSEHNRISYNKLVQFRKILNSYIHNDDHYSCPLSINSLYCEYPELLSLCMNSKNALIAISTFIENLELIHNVFGLKQYMTPHSITYQPIENKDFHIDYTLILPTFSILYQIASLYIPSPTVRLCFSDINVGKGIRRSVNSQFHTDSFWGQKVHSITFSTQELSIKSKTFNPILNQYQKKYLDEHYKNIFNEKHNLSLYVSNEIKTYFNDSCYNNDTSTINHICQSLNISRWTLNRKLKEEGINFKDILKEEKLNEAKKLLTNSTLSIQEISEQLNFSSQSSFSRFFRNQNGLTPLQYRKHNQTHILI